MCRRKASTRKEPRFRPPRVPTKRIDGRSDFGNQVERLSRIFLEPADFVFALLGVDVFPMGLTAFALHLASSLKSSTYDHSQYGQ